jgi:hypothetical protein
VPVGSLPENMMASNPPPDVTEFSGQLAPAAASEGASASNRQTIARRMESS